MIPVLCQAAFEVEPNNMASTANSIVPGVPMSGQLASTSDEDWFGFSVSSKTTVRVTFDSPENVSSVSFVYHTIQLRDSSGNVFASVDTGDDTVFNVTVLSAGTYFVVVRDGPYSVQSTNQYNLTITSHGIVGTAESEPNNNAASASLLYFGQINFGQIASETDQDWYSFNVGSSAAATVVFDSPEDVSSLSFSYHTIQVLDAEGLIYARVDTGMDKTFTVGLPDAGQYFLVVKDGPYSSLATKQYSVSIINTVPSQPSVIQALLYSAVEVVWNSEIGKNYVVEWSSDLSEGSWFPLSSLMSGTGSEMKYLDSIRGNLRGFYRIKEQ